MSEFYKLCEFSIAKRRDELEEVLRLRFLAYSKAGKLGANLTVSDMEDEFDCRSEMHIARFRQEVIGSLRVILNKESDALSYLRYVALPVPNLPLRKDIVEASRLCVHPDYIGRGLFYPFAARMALTAIKFNKRYILGGATIDLVPVWERCGFVPMRITYPDEDFNCIEHHLMLMDTLRVSNGVGTHENFNAHFIPLLEAFSGMGKHSVSGFDIR